MCRIDRHRAVAAAAAAAAAAAPQTESLMRWPRNSLPMKVRRAEWPKKTQDRRGRRGHVQRLASGRGGGRNGPRKGSWTGPEAAEFCHSASAKSCSRARASDRRRPPGSAALYSALSAVFSCSFATAPAAWSAKVVAVRWSSRRPSSALTSASWSSRHSRNSPASCCRCCRLSSVSSGCWSEISHCATKPMRGGSSSLRRATARGGADRKAESSQSAVREREPDRQQMDG